MRTNRECVFECLLGRVPLGYRKPLVILTEELPQFATLEPERCKEILAELHTFGYNI